MPALFLGEILAILVLRKVDDKTHLALFIMLVVLLAFLLVVRYFYLANSTWSKMIVIAFAMYLVQVAIRFLIATIFLLIGFYLAKVNLFNKLNLLYGGIFLVIGAFLSQFNNVDIWGGNTGDLLLFFINAVINGLAVITFSKEIFSKKKITQLSW